MREGSPTTLQQLAAALDGEIGQFLLLDETRYTGVLPGRRTIELRGDSGCFGWLTEYTGTTGGYVFSFVPNGALTYGVLQPVTEALRSHDVRVDQPADGR